MSPFARCLKIMKLENTQKGKEENEKENTDVSMCKIKKQTESNRQKANEEEQMERREKDLLPEFWHGF